MTNNYNNDGNQNSLNHTNNPQGNYYETNETSKIRKKNTILFIFKWIAIILVSFIIGAFLGTKIDIFEGERTRGTFLATITGTYYDRNNSVGNELEEDYDSTDEYEEWYAQKDLVLQQFVTEGGYQSVEEMLTDIILEFRKNEEAKETELESGTWYVGSDIPPGRYEVTPTPANEGEIIIADHAAYLYSYTTYEGSEDSSESTTIDLFKGMQIKISDIDHVTFVPVETEMKTELSCGKWIVGLDIEPGTYTITVNDGTSEVYIYEADASEDPGSESGYNLKSRDEYTVELKTGDIIEIDGDTVKFEEKSE